MSRIISYAKKYWILVAVIIIGLLYLTNLFIKTPNPQTSPSPTPKGASFDTLTPGVSTEGDVSKQLGKPINTNTNGSESVFEYKSTNKNRFHSVTYTNGIIVLVKEVINSTDNIKSDYITKDYGIPPYRLYSMLTNSTRQMV